MPHSIFTRTGPAFVAVAAAILSLSTAQADAPARLSDPYGLCNHIRSWPADWNDRSFTRSAETGANWNRADLPWAQMEPAEGQWRDDVFDNIVRVVARQKGINILPILDYDVPWAVPVWEPQNLDKWAEYVRRVVSRHKDDLRHWEVWNEPNLVWHWRERPKPTADTFVPLLKRSYEVIKGIDPGLTVVYPGVSGIPIDWIERSFQLGAGQWFDVMNVHPYHYPFEPEQMIPRLRELRELMNRHGVGHKPIWISETGYPTSDHSLLDDKVLPAAFDRAGIDIRNKTVAVVRDPKSEAVRANHAFDIVDGQGRVGFQRHGFGGQHAIRLTDIAGLNPDVHPVLVPALGEAFPAEYLPALRAYLNRGGSLYLPVGLPFYYDRDLATRKDVQVGDRHMADFHIGWETSWSSPGTPEHEEYRRAAPGFAGQFSVRLDADRTGGRFLTARNLRPGDEFIPVVEAGTRDYRGSVVGLYKLNSEGLKGNIVVNTLSPESVSEDYQARFLPRTYLTAFASGVSRVFWYNLHASEFSRYERENNFGIVGSNLEPKPAFHAYKTLTRLCPAGSTVPSLEEADGAYLSGWTRPDGVKVWAVWSIATGPVQKSLLIQGNITQAVDYLGESLAATPPGNGLRALTLSSGPLYLVGPASVSLP